MNLKKNIKFILFIGLGYYLFPSLNNGIGNFILELMLFFLLMYMGNIVINDGVNFIFNNWKKNYLRWIDEREHIKGNTLAEMSKLDFLGVIFRSIHYFSYNKKRFIQELWHSYLENVAITLTFIIFLLLILGFIIYAVNFK